MLLQFSVTNHRSIKDTAIISLKASTDKSLSDCLISPDEKKQLVPVLALYGANAAGKSNVLHALLLMREMVCGRYAKLLKGESLPQEPFAFTDQPTQPTSFEAIYFYGGIKYAYGFSFDKSKVLTEYLYHWPNGREALIFSRENNGYQFRENIQEQFTLAGRTAENRLYLSSSNEWNCPQTEKAYLWFFEKLTGFMGTEMRLDATLSAIRQGGSEKSRILHEMLYADLGIKDIRITGSKEEPIISALHTLDAEDGTSKGFWLPLGQESVGTQRFFSSHRYVACGFGIRLCFGSRRDRIQYAPAADKASDRDGAGCRYQYKPCTTHLHHARYRTSRPDVAAARSDLVCREERKDHADRYLCPDRVFSPER